MLTYLFTFVNPGATPQTIAHETFKIAVDFNTEEEVDEYIAANNVASAIRIE